MSIFDIIGGAEQHPVYQELEASNRDRQYSFLESTVHAALASGKPHLTHDIVRALNYHAIAYLHVAPGQFRHMDVAVMKGKQVSYKPPKAFMIETLMGQMLSRVQNRWQALNAIS